MTITARLDEVAELNPRLRDRPRDDAVVSFLAMADVSSDGSTTEGLDRRFGDTAKGYTQFRRGDVLVAKITPCFENGKIAQAFTRNLLAAGSTEFHVVRPNLTMVDGRYLHHYLRQPRIRAEGESRMTGSAGQRRVPASYLAQLQIPIPPLEVQGRIAALLDQSDRLKGKRRRAISLLDDLAQAIFSEMFGDLVRNERSWQRGSISSFVKGFETGKSLAEGEDETASRFRILKISAVTSGRFIASESKPAPDKYDPPVSHIVHGGDLLFSRANTSELIGATAFVPDGAENLLMPDKLWRFVWNDEKKPSPWFVHYLFKQPSMRGMISRNASGTSGSMKNISQGKVLSIKLGIPPVELQHEFEERVLIVEDDREHAQNQADTLNELFDSLQEKAFRGEL